MSESAFITDLRVEDITEGTDTQTLRLLAPFRVYSQTLDAIITVPEGFIFDGESIPAWLQGLVKPFGQSKRGACVHDYLYRYGAYITTSGGRVEVSRAQADKVYFELVRAKGLPSWRANIRWGVLRLVGWAAWNSSAKDRRAS
jgi:hypothetical protein